MDFGTILEKIIEHGGPAMIVAVAFLYYMHRQNEKKDAKILDQQKEIKELNAKRVDDSEKRLFDNLENRKIIERLVDKTGHSNTMVREYFAKSDIKADQILNEIRMIRTEH